MKRLDLFEFEDQGWFPSFMRDAATTYLQFISHKLRVHEAMVPLIEELTAHCGCNRIIDLCSGSAGPLVDIAECLYEHNREFKVVLTDKFPNLPAFKRARANHPEFIEFEEAPIDAVSVPEVLIGVRTIFNAFHHFRPKFAKQILANAVQAGQCIAVFELSERRLINVLSFPVIFILVLMALPFLRPFRWSWLLFTYAIPIIPLTIAWDGMVSHLRAYSTDELRSLTLEYADTYLWRIVRRSWRNIPITALIGMATPSAIRDDS